MILPDTNSKDYQMYKTLNEDVKLQRVNDKSKHWDIQMENFDYVNVTGLESLKNAITIAIMTRFKELGFIDMYGEFGCKVHELIKANKSKMVMYKVKSYIMEVLDKMRRIATVNNVTVTESESHSYLIEYNVTSIYDETITGSVEL